MIPRLEEVLYSGYIAQGEVVENFERKFEEYIGSGNTLSLNSGTAALHIALILAGVGQGDEVISTALTAEPTNVAIKMVGAKVRWA
ncbi:DegT/DnrJ/EryC1/StrS family aminotransferase, partial [Acinetobacter baumannii]